MEKWDLKWSKFSLTMHLTYGPYLKYKTTNSSGEWTGSILLLSAEALRVLPAIYVSDKSKEFEVLPIILDNAFGYNFLRFDLTLRQSEFKTKEFNYSVRVEDDTGTIQSKDYQFYIAGSQEPWRSVFFSCNGYSESVKKIVEGKPKVGGLWKEIMQMHKSLRRDSATTFLDGIEFSNGPWHVQIGGGGQIYSDEVFEVASSLTEWIATNKHVERIKIPFSKAMDYDVSKFYFDLYTQQFSEPIYADALASIPCLNNWDDHDIFDGFGSHNSSFQTSPVVQGLGKVALRFYLLFQQHTNPLIAREDGFFGAKGYHYVTNMGPRVGVLGIDNRWERSKHDVVLRDSYEMIWENLKALPDTIQHILVLAPIPVAFPDLTDVEHFLGILSKFRKHTWLGKLLTKSQLLKFTPFMFAGEPEPMDDVIDHYSSPYHKAEKSYFLERLQAIASAKSARITFISGDVHCCGFARFRSDDDEMIRCLGTPATDHRLMYQVISSAITNVPPPRLITTYFNWLAKRHNKRLIKASPAKLQDMCVAEHTVEEFLRLTGKKKHFRKGTFFIQRRNWCSVCETDSSQLKFELHTESKKNISKEESRKGYDLEDCACAEEFVLVVDPLL